MPTQSIVPDSRGNKLVMFSQDGKDRSEEEFVKAYENYIRKKPTPGFTVMPAEGVTTSLRRAFESVNVPLQRGAETVGNLPDIPGRAGQFGGVGEPNPIAGLYNLVRKGVPYLAETVSSPAKAAATAGSLVAGGVTKGVSGLLPLLARVGMPALAAGGASLATGDDFTKSMNTALLVATAAGASEGAFGVFKTILKRSLPQRAKQQVIDDVLTTLKKEYGHIGTPSKDSINAVLSTKQGIEKFVRIGVKGLRSANKEYIDDFVLQLNSSLPRTLGKVGQRRMRRAVDLYLDAMDGFLNNIGDSGGQREFRSKAIKSLREMVGIIKDDFGKANTKIGLNAKAVLEQAHDDLSKKLMSLETGAEVLAALKESGAGTDFNVARFQKIMKDKIVEATRRAGTEDTLFHQIAKSAGRGTIGGVDVPLTVRGKGAEKLLMSKGPLGKYSIPAPKVGTRYVGKVTGVPDTAAANIVSIKEFLERENK